MPLSNEIPNKCLECRKYSRPTIHSKCDFCQDLELHEELLCDLNRQVQNIQDFSCYAFTPSLKLVTSSAQKTTKFPTDPNDIFPQKSLQQILASDNLKYQMALAAQKLGNDPDAIVMNIKYHFVWNVIHRRTIFSNPAASVERVSEVFLDCSEVVDSFVRLLWLAPDHVHIYVESDGDKSVDTLAQELKKISASSIAVKDIGLMTSSDASFNLWDKAYFVETLG